jgi:16S rRNA C1402 N4-methylase RsmH
MMRLVTRKPIRPSAAEVALNPASRSAKLRVIEKVNHSSQIDRDQPRTG